jgi:hypothetical protein
VQAAPALRALAGRQVITHLGRAEPCILAVQRLALVCVRTGSAHPGYGAASQLPCLLREIGHASLVGYDTLCMVC